MATKLGLGGPTVERAVKQEPESLIELDDKECEATHEHDVGSPLRQVGICKRRARPAEIVLLPPRIRKAVASSLCPSALLRHVAEV